jgi:hypothetical protein
MMQQFFRVMRVDANVHEHLVFHAQEPGKFPFFVAALDYERDLARASTSATDETKGFAATGMNSFSVSAIWVSAGYLGSGPNTAPAMLQCPETAS